MGGESYLLSLVLRKSPKFYATKIFSLKCNNTMPKIARCYTQWDSSAQPEPEFEFDQRVAW